MKNKVLALAAAAEAGTGLLLLLWPAIVVRVLFGAEIVGVGVIMSRLAGIALIGLGVACWPGHDTRWPFYGMLTYTVLVMVYLLVVGKAGHAGVLLWRAVVAHAILAVLLLLARFRKGRTAAAQEQMRG